MELVNAVVGIIQLVIAIILAVVALYIGFSVLGKITKGIDEEKEIAKGNVAVGILVAAGLVLQGGDAADFVAVQPGTDGAPGELVMRATEHIGKALVGHELDALAHRVPRGVVHGMQHPQAQFKGRLGRHGFYSCCKNQEARLCMSLENIE